MVLRKVGQNKCRGKFKMVEEGGISKILNEYKSKFKINVCNVAIIEKNLLYNGQNIFDSTLRFTKDDI